MPQGVVTPQAAPSTSSAATPISSAGDERMGVTDTEITIGSCVDRSGQLRLRGVAATEGARVYFQSINDRGGVNGRKINFVTKDDGYDPEKAIDCYNLLVEARMFAGTVFLGTATAAKYVPMTEEHRVPIVGFLTGARFLHEPFHRYVFTARASFDDEAEQQVDVLWNKLGLRKIAVVYQEDALGAAVDAAVTDSLKKLHGEPVAHISFPRLTRDVDDVVRRLAATNPEAVILGGTADAIPDMAKKIHAQKMKILLVALSPATDPLIDGAGAQADGTLITQDFPFIDGSLPGVKLYRELLKKYAPGQTPDISGFEGFIYAAVVVDALKRAGRDLTRDRFINALEATHNLDLGLGPSFEVSYTPQQHSGIRTVSFGVVKNGKVAPITDFNALRPR